MKRRLFCQLSPWAYQLSVLKCRGMRKIRDGLSGQNFALLYSEAKLPVCIYRHHSLIRRTLGDVDPVLQENKAVNLSLASKMIHQVLIKPNQVFSLWKLVGSCTKEKGYLPGLTISSGNTGEGIGGGLCQLSNLIHWIILHSPLEIIEHHHHNHFDLFPDFGRKVPFGTGTSIFYNYLDYRFINRSDQAYQLLVWVDDKNLHGELRAEKALDIKYHIRVQDEYFEQRDNDFYRINTIYRDSIDKRTGKLAESVLIKENCAKVLYDSSYIRAELIRKSGLKNISKSA